MKIKKNTTLQLGDKIKILSRYSDLLKINKIIPNKIIYKGTVIKINKASYLDWTEVLIKMDDNRKHWLLEYEMKIIGRQLRINL